MVVILACLSLILTAGGGAMALYGADLIRSESGIALIQSGIIMLSSGLVLAGLTTAVSELRRMRKLMELEEPVPVPALAPPPVLPVVEAPAPAAPPVPADPAPAAAPPAAPPLEVPAAAAQAVRPAEPALAIAPKETKADRAAGEPAPRPPLPPVPEGRRPPGSGIPAEAKASLVGIKAARQTQTAPAASEAAPSGPSPGTQGVGTAAPAPGEAGMAVATNEANAGGDSAAGQEGAAGQGPEAGMPAAVPVHPAADGGERKMLATYNSGGITYFMFSDGSIEADMTGGRYRFTSMDELRGYIDTGKGGVLVEPAPARDAG